ncbi:MAG: acyltransferase family protein [Sneathiella sp.]
MSPRIAIFLASATFVLYSIYILNGTAESLYQWSKDLAPYEIRQHLGLSKRFLLQYGHVFFLIILLFLSRYIFRSDAPLRISGKITQVIGKYTSAVFLIHFPILFFLAAITHHNPNSSLDQILLLTGAIVLSILFGRFCFMLKPAFDAALLSLTKRLDLAYPKSKQTSEPIIALQLTRSHSEFLNLVKIISMGAVVLGHFSFREFTHYTLPGFDGSAPRFAVPVFFMLSGYFLMLSIDRCRTGPATLLLKKYWSLYYLILPMLALVPILDAIGYGIDPTIYWFDDYYVFERERGPLGMPIFFATVINSVLYLNEIWIYNLMGLSDMKGGIVAFSNDPYWFMCYLLSYTLLMIVWRMVSGIRRYILTALICLVIGPPVLLLAPLFFAGGLTYLLHKRLE